MTSDALGNIYLVGYMFNITDFSCTPPVNGEYPICNANGVSFSQSVVLGGTIFGDGFIAKFNPNTELTWSTLFGGNDNEIIFDVAYDNLFEKLYIAGYTSSTRTQPPTCNPNIQFPLCGGGSSYFQQDMNGVADGFLAMFDKDNKLKYSTYFGGNNDDAITGVDVNSKGDVFVTGRSNTTFTSNTCSAPTNTSFPLCNLGGTATVTPNAGGFDAFVARFDNSTHALSWSTFIGGDKDEGMDDIFVWGTAFASLPRLTINYNDDIIIVGNTKSGTTGSTTQYPTANFSPVYYTELDHADLGGTVNNDTYLTIFDKSSLFLSHSTYFGGIGADEIGNVSTYQDKIYITGGTLSTPSTFPLNCPSAFPNPYCDQTRSNVDAFVAQLSIDGYIGVNEQEDEETGFIVFPNPSNDIINIMLENDYSSDVVIEIFDVMGKLLLTESAVKQTNVFSKQVNIEYLSKGVYFVKVKTENNYYTKSFVKQ